MNLKKVLSPDTVWVDLKADTKNGIGQLEQDRIDLALRTHLDVARRLVEALTG